MAARAGGHGEPLRNYRADCRAPRQKRMVEPNSARLENRYGSLGSSRVQIPPSPLYKLDSAAHGGIQRALPGCARIRPMIAAVAIMMALVVWAALSAARLVVRGLLVLAFLPYYLRRR